MRKFIALLMFFALGGMVAAQSPTVSTGSATFARTTPDTGFFEVVRMVCTSDATTTAVTVTGLRLDGQLVRVVTDPGATAPTDNYDITLTDADGADVLAGLGANRDTANTEEFAPMIGNGTGVHGATSPGGMTPPFISGLHTLSLSEMGASKVTTLILYLRRF